jgi:hypothetical protein
MGATSANKRGTGSSIDNLHLGMTRIFAAAQEKIAAIAMNCRQSGMN